MKARVKHTGEWITVNPCNYGFYEVGTHDIYEPDELDFAAGFDWSSFRREAAKDILCALVGNKDYLKVIGRTEPETMLAIRFADELIKQLKEK